MSWLLNAIYVAILTALSPLVLWRQLRHGRYRRGLSEKLLGRLPELAKQQPVVWFHAVSVGEVLQLQKVVSEFRHATVERYQVLITTSTDTGYDLACSRFDDCTVSWFPLDFSWAVHEALERVQPDLVVLTELEFWPNFLRVCRQRQIRTAVINARISDRSFRGYSRISWLIGPLLNHFCVVAAQSREYAGRLMKLGAAADRTVVTGSIKFDGVEMDRCNARTMALGAMFGIDSDDVVVVAGSTQDPEETMACDSWTVLREGCPSLRLIIVPRHAERFDIVAMQLADRGVPFVRRSLLANDAKQVPKGAVILLDTIGELGACWGLADIAFVGGSFGTRGGQNMLEPAAYGAAVMFGPNTWNFRDIVRLLLTQQSAMELSSIEEFTGTLRQFIETPSLRHELGAAAQRVVRQQQGAVTNTIQQLAAALDDDSARIQQRAA